MSAAEVLMVRVLFLVSGKEKGVAVFLRRNALYPDPVLSRVTRGYLKRL